MLRTLTLFSWRDKLRSSWRCILVFFGFSCLLSFSVLLYVTFLFAFFQGGSVVIVVNRYGEMWFEFLIIPICLFFGFFAFFDVFTRKYRIRLGRKHVESDS